MQFSVSTAKFAIGRSITTDDDEADERNNERKRHVVAVIGNSSHDDGGNGTANDAHDEQGGSGLRMFAQTTDGERENGGEHDALAKEAEEEEIESRATSNEHDDEHGERCANTEIGQKALR